MRKVLAILGLTMVLLLVAEPAMSLAWGPESTWYKGKKRATGHGDFFNDQNVRAINRMTVVDDAPEDGNKVYGYTSWYFYHRKCWAGVEECETDFHREGHSSTAEFNGGAKVFDLKKSLLPTGSKARAQTFACAQMGWPVPDGCAPAAYPTFDY
jgi:hypothetical protein